jgi:hypothetical protein
MLTYRDLNAIRLPVLMTLALRGARAEFAECLAIGYAKPWRECLSEALKRVWEVAKAQRDAVVAITHSPAIDPVSALRRELDLLPYREDYRGLPKCAAGRSLPNWHGTQVDHPRNRPVGLLPITPLLATDPSRK